MDPDTRRRILNSVAAVNLKKVPGGSTANFAEIQRFARDNAAFLRRQLDLYKPDYIVGCGHDVADILYGDVYEQRPDWKVTSRGIWHAPFGEAKYIYYWHPNARWPANLLYYGLIDAVREVGSWG